MLEPVKYSEIFVNQEKTQQLSPGRSAQYDFLQNWLSQSNRAGQLHRHSQSKSTGQLAKF